jgi:hypothetical protein
MLLKYRERQKRIDRQSAMRLENIMSSMGKKDVPTVNVVLKTRFLLVIYNKNFITRHWSIWKTQNFYWNRWSC